jgi:hypothetical protein
MCHPPLTFVDRYALIVVKSSKNNPYFTALSCLSTSVDYTLPVHATTLLDR